MLNIMEVHETNQMIEQEKLDVRTITMGINLMDCARADVDETCEAIYAKITHYAKDLVSTGESIERDFGIPIVNKRITVIITVATIAALVTVFTVQRRRLRGAGKPSHHARGRH